MHTVSRYLALCEQRGVSLSTPVIEDLTDSVADRKLFVSLWKYPTMATQRQRVEHLAE